MMFHLGGISGGSLIGKEVGIGTHCAIRLQIGHNKFQLLEGPLPRPLSVNGAELIRRETS